MSDQIFPKGDGNNSASMNVRGERSYQVTYQVETEIRRGPGYVRNLVLTHLGGIGATYSFQSESDAESYLHSIDVSHIADEMSWEAACKYEAFEPLDENPLNHPAEVSIDWQPFQKLTDRDREGNAILNSAGDPLDPPIERSDSLPILKVSRNEDTYPLFDVFGMRDSLNNAEWNGFPAGTVKASAPRSVRQYHPAIGFYWRTDYEFEINPSGWNAHVLDNGLRELDGDERHNILVDGQPASSPVLLNGSGQVLDPTGEPVFLTYEMYEPKSFSFWGITLA